jgi:hypothetical protein
MSCLITILWLSALTLTLLRRHYLVSKRTAQLEKKLYEQKAKKGKSQDKEEAGKKGDDV